MQEEQFFMTMMESGEEQMAKEEQRMKQCYPKRAYCYVAEIEKECDKMEYEGSPMYAEILDRESIYRMAERMAKKEEDQEMIMLMLCHEMYMRRCRKTRRCRMFH